VWNLNNFIRSPLHFSQKRSTVNLPRKNVPNSPTWWGVFLIKPQHDGLQQPQATQRSVSQSADCLQLWNKSVTSSYEFSLVRETWDEPFFYSSPQTMCLLAHFEVGGCVIWPVPSHYGHRGSRCTIQSNQSFSS